MTYHTDAKMARDMSMLTSVISMSTDLFHAAVGWMAMAAVLGGDRFIWGAVRPDS